MTIVRDPYDAFVSMYHWIQTRTDYDRERGRVRPKERPRDAMVGKAIDDPVDPRVSGRTATASRFGAPMSGSTAVGRSSSAMRISTAIRLRA